MTWEAIGAIGEIVGAAAVLLTLIILVFQMRANTRTMQESNRLERASAVDRHSDSMARWRGRLAENSDLARIWMIGRNDGELDEVESLRLSNLWIDLVNTQRANFVRARIVGEDGLAQQAVLSVAAEQSQSKIFQREWQTSRPWHELASPEFVTLVDKEANNWADGNESVYRASAYRPG